MEMVQHWDLLVSQRLGTVQYSTVWPPRPRFFPTNFSSGRVVYRE